MEQLKTDYCSHTETRVEQMPPGQRHYAAVVCSNCKKTIMWRPHPRNIALRKQNAINIRKLLTSAPLSSWEHGFLTALEHHRPSASQQAKLDDLVQKHLRQKGIT